MSNSTNYIYVIAKWRFYGKLLVPTSKTNLFQTIGKKKKITDYASLTQGEPDFGISSKPSILTLKLKISKKDDALKTIFEFTEKFLTTMLLSANIDALTKHPPITKRVDPSTTNVANFILAKGFRKKKHWQPVDHFALGHSLISGTTIEGYAILTDNVVNQIKNYSKNITNLCKNEKKSVELYKIGSKLMYLWRMGAFLSFYKIIEIYLESEYKNIILQDYRTKLNFQGNNRSLWRCISGIQRMEWICKHLHYFSTIHKLESKRRRRLIRGLPKLRNSISHPDRIPDVDSDSLNECRQLSKFLIDIHLV
ncbi:MAG: hypothetical protein EPO62_00385 [Candidatus Nitrosotenuis sp.]|nr:MAG: hypothetical protein EPO62_00385 [Candidatus Nitrosotenuis sp.]